MSAENARRQHEAPEVEELAGSETCSISTPTSTSSLTSHLRDGQSVERRPLELQNLLRSLGDRQIPLSPVDSPTSHAAEEDIEHDDVRAKYKHRGHFDTYTEQEERAVVRKLDTRLVVFMSLLYMLSFLDRSNIGNARIAGLETSLSLRSGQYAWLLTAFYITYISFEWMALLYRVIPAHIYIPLCVLSWGVVASLQSAATSFTSLVILRAILGVAEAAFGPGVPFYLSFFYKRSELAYRVGLFISAAPLATSFASSLAWLIVKAFQHGPIEPWRALFLIEGFPSIIAAIFAWYIIPDSPAAARYLTTRERKVAILRLQGDEPSKTKQNETNKTHDHYHKQRRISLHDLLHTLTDPKAYLASFMFFSANVSFSSLPVFLPTILNSSQKLTALQSQLLSAPPYLLAFPFLLYTSRLSDQIPNSRSTAIILTSLLSSLSYLSLALAGHYHELIGPTPTFLIRYTAVFGAAMGFFAAITIIITWTINNQPTATGKGTGIALLNVVGQCGPLVGTRLYPDSDEPFFVPGMLICAAFMAGVSILAAVLRWWFVRLNNRIVDANLCGDDAGDGGQGFEMDPIFDVEEEEEGLSGTETTAAATSSGRERGRRRRRKRRTTQTEQTFTYML